MATTKRKDLVDIDLNGPGVHRSWINRKFWQEQDVQHCFGVRVFRDGKPVDLNGASVKGYFRNSAGETKAISSGTIENTNTAYVTLTSACYTEPGQFALAIKLIGGGTTITVRIVDGTMEAQTAQA